MEQGMEQGMKQGLEQGLEQGREEAIIETAKKFKQAGTDTELISQCTGLSIDEINAL